jgi:c-di-GMP-binding flagellar brake protein YcgR
MRLAIDLTPRQGARVLEQALRAKADFEIEPRNLPDDEPLHGQLLGREGDLLVVQMRDTPAAVPLSVLTGAFCDIRTILSGELYTFTTCVLDVTDEPAGQRALMVSPETIQVTNRRQFERTNATVASQVRLWMGSRIPPTVGLLANVSAGGLACNLPGTDLDSALALGDELQVSFELAGFDDVFELPVVLCSKTLSRDRQQLSLGMRFCVRPDDPAAQRALERVRAVLFELMVDTTDMDGGL